MNNMEQMSSFILEVSGLTKKYRDVTALKNFSVKLESNKIYGLLGRNGAGKTTLLDIITSRIFADSGEVMVMGRNAVENQEILPCICYMPEKNYFITSTKVSEIFNSAAMFFDNFDMQYADQLCDKFNLDKRKKYKALSRGYESILRIIIGLASRAPLTIFDEPVLGLDAAVRDLFYRELLDDYAKNPRTLIISTHLIEESADVFEDVLIIREGELVSQMQVTDLREMAFYISGRPADVESAAAGHNVIHDEIVGNVRISAIFEKLTEESMRELKSCNVDIAPIPVQKLFIYLTDSCKEEKL